MPTKLDAKAGPMYARHDNDKEGRPGGGATRGVGFSICWQDGPLGRDGDRIEPNGAFVEDVILAAMDRIDYYQDSEFASAYNSSARDHLALALHSLEARTTDREAREVEGTHAI